MKCETLREAIATEQEVTPLLIARALLEMQWKVREAQNAITRLETELEVLTNEAYRMAGYEKRQSGGYGPAEEKA